MFTYVDAAILDCVRSIPLSHEMVLTLLRRLEIDDSYSCSLSNKPTTSEIGWLWHSTKKSGDWKDLVEVMLTEPGLGYSVMGVLPAGEKRSGVCLGYM